jgi:PilZ domain-containing protein
MATSSPPADAYAVQDNRRIHPRVVVALPAFVHAGGERHAAQLLDLSPGGAKLKVDARLPVGSAVMLDCGTFDCAGVVRWQNDDLVGLRFDSELSAAELAAQVERSEALAAWRKARE